MKLIFALGNTGNSYIGTRHNAGFAAAEAFVAHQRIESSLKAKFKAQVAELTVNNEKVLVAFPITFYNNVGESYRLMCDYYKIAPENTLILHDELALPFGTIRTRTGGSDAGNNGIKSINQHGGDASMRLRVGVANETRSLVGDTDFVLGRFSKCEQAAFDIYVCPAILDILEAFIANGHLATTVSAIPIPAVED